MARTKSVLLRLSEEEYARLKELAGREPMNAYLRRMAGLDGFERATDQRTGETTITYPEPSRVGNKQIRQRCSAKGCTWTTTRSGAERCPEHGFSSVVDA